METVRLSYNGTSHDYVVGKTTKTRENKIPLLVEMFAENYVIYTMIENGSLKKENFIESVGGSPIMVNPETTDKKILDEIKSETQKIIPLVDVHFNKSL